jgi:hypothetical protein
MRDESRSETYPILPPAEARRGPGRPQGDRDAPGGEGHPVYASPARSGEGRFGWGSPFRFQQRPPGILYHPGGT